ncbi:hypothetical protein O3M35_006833 [Rhynocoris fuscipes]|uniref:EB domain-containing protein n=1 Tax=Rhynocoris fuscipes TaxID=488301 RepID=A0AAW1DMI2_9HEMI
MLVLTMVHTYLLSLPLVALFALSSSAENATSSTVLTTIRSITNRTASMLNSTRPSVETTTIKMILTQEVRVENNTAVNVSNSVTGNSSDGNQLQVSAVESKPDSGVVTYFKQLYQLKSVIGDNCTKQEDCEGRESYCLEGTCQCQEGYVSALDRSRCLPVVRSIGEKCLEDAQCYKGLNLKEDDAKCISFKCLCGTGTVYSSGTCIKSIYLGNKCENDRDCLTLNSRCLQGVCACPLDMVPGAENRQCLPAIKSLDQNCTQDDQCQEYMGDNSLCHEEKCQCKPRTHFNGTVCITDLKLGESCSSQTDCIVSNENGSGTDRHCVQGKCSCPPNFKEIIEEDACINAATDLLINSKLLLLLLLIIPSRLICL